MHQLHLYALINATMSVQQPTTIRPHRRLGKQVLTSIDVGVRADASVAYTLLVQLNSKQREILTYVSRFQQLSTKQIKALVYPGQPFDPQRRTLDELLKYKLLVRVNQRMHGGPVGGSQMYVYQLGSEGRKHYYSGRRGTATVINYHSLAIADVFVQLKDAERDRQAKLFNYATEPDTHIELGGVLLKPDLYIDIGIRATNQRRAVWIEVDLGTERQKQVLEQATAYKLAYQSRSEYPLDVYPTVVFLASSAERAAEIEYWLKRAGDPDGLFTVGTLDQVIHMLQR